jgi:type IV pilus assembly protein PilX
MHRLVPSLSLFSQTAQSRYQSGFVLVTAMVFLAILALLTAISVRKTLSETSIAGNDADVVFAAQNAELALRDAERDIRGLAFTGVPCALSGGLCTLTRPAGSRPSSVTATSGFWSGAADKLDESFESGGTSSTDPTLGQYKIDEAEKCGIPIWSAANWNDNVARSCPLTGTTPRTVPYGAFTGAVFNADSNTTNIGTVIAPRYMIELYTSGGLGIVSRNVGSVSGKNFFRITAVGYGRLRSATGVPTTVTQQVIFSPD